MGEVVEFKKRELKHMITVCDVQQDSYQIFEADSISTPELLFDEYDAWWFDDVISVQGPQTWGPITIEGSQEIADAIRNCETAPRVTFESQPRTKHWWELHNVYLSTESEKGKHIIRFSNCTKHNYNRTEPKY